MNKETFKINNNEVHIPYYSRINLTELYSDIITCHDKNRVHGDYTNSDSHPDRMDFNTNQGLLSLTVQGHNFKYLHFIHIDRFKRIIHHLTNIMTDIDDMHNTGEIIDIFATALYDDITLYLKTIESDLGSELYNELCS